MRFHDLRHTAATHMLIGDAHPFTVQEILGHKTLEMTRRYSHVTERSKHEAVAALSWNTAARNAVGTDVFAELRAAEKTQTVEKTVERQ